MNKSELDQVWHSVTSALENEFWTRGWFSPHAARIEQLEAALRKAVTVFESWHDDETEVELLPQLRAALAPEQDR